MLLNQASALESIFTSLAIQATRAKGVRQSNEILTLALKAQSGSRATINTLIDLKFPRTGATFVKQQNNLSQGPQQVNNGVPAALPLASTAPVSITQEAPKAIGAPCALPIQGVVKPLLTTNSRVRKKKR